MNKIILSAAALAAALLGQARPALANDDHLLGTSKAHKLSIIALGGDAWCAPSLKLKMVIEADSPDRQNPAAQIEVMNKLKTPITTDCKAAKSAELTVIDHGEFAGRYAANDQGGWIFSAASSPGADLDTASTTPAPAPSPAPTVATAPARGAASAAFVVPKEMDYAAALLRIAHDKPALLEDDGFAHQWAALRYTQEFNQVVNQEFKLRPLTERAKADLKATLARTDTDYLAVSLSVQFGSYDFNTQRFPITITSQEVQIGKPCCYTAPGVPASLRVKVPDLDSIAGLEMPTEAAQLFVQRRTQWGTVNRGLHVVAIIKLDAGGFTQDGWGNAASSGTLQSAAIFADPHATDPLSVLDPAKLEQLRTVKAAEKAAAAKAEADRQAEMRRQQLVAQRGIFIQGLSAQPDSVKLANFISDGQINYFQHLDNLRAARGVALAQAHPVTVSMLVQADGSGRDKVATAWPGKLLQVTAGEGQPAFESGQWYLVRGALTVPDGDDLPPAHLTAQQVYACKQAKCQDAADPAAVVDHKLAGSTAE